MKKLLHLTVLCTCVLLSCATNRSAMQTSEKTHSPLFGTKWLLKSIHSDTGKVSVDTKAFLRFDSTKNSAGGNGSCNAFGSDVTVSRDTLTITNIFSTKMYCEGVQHIENAFFGALAKATRFDIEGNVLILKGDKGILLEFVAGDMKEM
jgi:heat shock protein HslJ